MPGLKNTPPTGVLPGPPGQDVSADEADQLGAFSEDALSEADARAAAADERLSPAEALCAPRAAAVTHD